MYVPGLDGVTHSKRGLPPSTVAPFVHTVRPPSEIDMLTLATFDSRTCTPARWLVCSVRVSNSSTGGAFTYSRKCLATAQ